MKRIVGALILLTCCATSVHAADASLDAPVSAAAGSRIQVKWVAPGAPQELQVD